MCFGVFWIDNLPKLSFFFAFFAKLLMVGSIIKISSLTQNSIRLHLCTGLSSLKTTLKIVGQPLLGVLLGCRVRVSTLPNLKSF